MGIRRKIVEYSRGNDLNHFWRLYRWQKRIESGILHDVLTFFMSRCAYRHGGYIGPDAVIKGRPTLCRSAACPSVRSTAYGQSR